MLGFNRFISTEMISLKNMNNLSRINVVIAWIQLQKYIFLKVGTPSGVYLFDHLLWSIWQDSNPTKQSHASFEVSALPTSHHGWVKSVTYFPWKILALDGIWTWDLSGTKPICYPLSYPGLDMVLFDILGSCPFNFASF